MTRLVIFAVVNKKLNVHTLLKSLIKVINFSVNKVAIFTRLFLLHVSLFTQLFLNLDFVSSHLICKS